MNLRLEDIPEDGLEIDLESKSAAFAEALRDISESATPPSLAGRMHLIPVGGVKAFWVDGSVQTEVTVTCSRCLEPVQVEVDEAFRVMIQAREEAFAGSEEEIELDADSLDVSFFDAAAGIQIDELVREQIILALPLIAVCSESCQGICQQCGADLNREPCRCGAAPVDPRFAVLAGLKGSR